MARVSAYLKFNGNCREAFEYYRECLGGELDVMPVKDTQMADQMPPEMHDQVMHAALTKGDMVLYGSDNLGQEDLKQGTTVSLCYNGTKEEIDEVFNKLAADGEVGHPITEMFFGYYGDLTDKYGFNWLLQADK